MYGTRMLIVYVRVRLGYVKIKLLKLLLFKNLNYAKIKVDDDVANSSFFHFFE